MGEIKVKINHQEEQQLCHSGVVAIESREKVHKIKKQRQSFLCAEQSILKLEGRPRCR